MYSQLVTFGGCVVVFRGKEYRVTAIEPYDVETGRAAYPRAARVVLKLTGRNEFRLLRIQESTSDFRGSASPGTTG